MRAATKKTEPVLDPLYVIFEQHLYNFQDSDQDRKTFICNVIRDYLTHLRQLKMAIPPEMEKPIVEELAAQVNAMLVKKIYGCLSIDDYRKEAKKKVMDKGLVRRRYLTLRKVKAE